jgi:hypothetical protein
MTGTRLAGVPWSKYAAVDMRGRQDADAAERAARADHDTARSREIAIDQERAGHDGPGLVAGSGQGPGRGVDLVVGGEAGVLGADESEVKRAGAGPAELERVGAAGDDIAVDDAGRGDRQGVAGAAELNRRTVHPGDSASIEYGRAGRGLDRREVSADDAAHIVDDVGVIELDRDAEVAGDRRYRDEIGDRGKGCLGSRNRESISCDDA